MSQKRINSLHGAEDFIKQLANDLRNAPRLGAEKDVPEGARYIQVSDTLARYLSAALDEVAEELGWAVPGSGDE